MADIDIGSAALEREANFGGAGYTSIDENNPANNTGTITSVEIWAGVNMTGCRIGTFYTTNGNTLKCRDSATIGNVTAGSKQTFTEDSGGNPLAIEVSAGDYIGLYYATGDIRYDFTGLGVWYASGEHIDPNDEATYTHIASRTISLYGEGVLPVTWEDLSGLSAGVASVSGTVTRKRPISGSSGGVASVAGAIVRDLALAGISQGVASVSGFTRVKRALSGISSGIASVSGSIDVLVDLSGVSAGVAEVIGSLGRIRPLAGITAGIASVSGFIRISIELSGLSAGVATVSGSLSRIRNAVRNLLAVRNISPVRTIPPVR